MNLKLKLKRLSFINIEINEIRRQNNLFYFFTLSKDTNNVETDILNNGTIRIPFLDFNVGFIRTSILTNKGLYSIHTFYTQSDEVMNEFVVSGLQEFFAQQDHLERIDTDVVNLTVIESVNLYRIFDFIMYQNAEG